jgi:hypothetical protein
MEDIWMKTCRIVVALIALCWIEKPVSAMVEGPLVYPIPQQITRLETSLPLVDGIAVIVSNEATTEDRFLVRFLVADMADRYGIAGVVEQVSQLPSGRPWILMGTQKDKLIVEAMRNADIIPGAPWAVPEGYVLHADKSGVLIAGNDARGAFYGLQSLRQLIRRNCGTVSIQGAHIVDWPHMPFRGVKLFLPGRDNIPFFKIFKPMSWATLFSILAAVAGGLGATALHGSLAQSGGEFDIVSPMMRGLAEAMVPAVFGFALLALGWMLVSVGLRRKS